MIIYNDIFTGKTILTDSYPLKLIDDFVYEVSSQYITKKGDEFGDELFGGNASVEEQAEELDGPGCKCGFDVIINHEEVEEWAEEPNFKRFIKMLKPVISKAAAKLDPDRAAKFKKGCNEFFKSGKGCSDKFKNFQIFFSKDCIDCETGDLLAAPIIVDADESGMKATIYYFKDLMVEEKM